MDTAYKYGLETILGNNGPLGSVEMFDTVKKKKKPGRGEELKNFLEKYDTSKSEIGKQLEYIGSQFKFEYYEDRDVRDRGVGSVKFDRVTGRDAMLIGNF